MIPKHVKELIDGYVSNIFPKNGSRRTPLTEAGIKVEIVNAAQFGYNLDRWINVEDGLPEDYYSIGYSKTVAISDGVTCGFGMYNFTAKRWVIQYIDGSVMNEVTHYQLITPPKD